MLKLATPKLRVAVGAQQQVSVHFDQRQVATSRPPGFQQSVTGAEHAGDVQHVFKDAIGEDCREAAFARSVRASGYRGSARVCTRHGASGRARPLGD